MDLNLCCFILMQVWITISQTVNISGPDFVKLNDAITLNCTTDNDPFGPSASFLVNGRTHADLHYNHKNNQCYKDNSQCTENTCSCSSDGKTYSLIYKATSVPAYLQFKCEMLFETDRFKEVTDNITVRVVDVRGPFLTSTTGFPLIAGTQTTVHCSVNTTLNNYTINLNCSTINTVYSQFCLGYDKGCKATVQFVASTTNVCVCLIDSNEFTTVETFNLVTKNVPLLKLDENHQCITKKAVTLSCQIDGDLTKYGFANWTHTFDGVWIRSLPGLIYNDTAKLKIESCSFRHLGKYECSAWNEYSNGIAWANATTVVTILGKPEIVRNNTHYGNTTILSAVFYSATSINSTEWFLFDSLLQNTSEYLQTISKGKADLHEQRTSIDVYIVTMTMNSVNAGSYTVFIGNEQGKTKFIFYIEYGRGKFDFNDITLILSIISVFIITVPIATIIYKKLKGHCLRGKVVIYHAAVPQQQEPSIYNETNRHYTSIYGDKGEGPYYSSVNEENTDKTEPIYDEASSDLTSATKYPYYSSEYDRRDAIEHPNSSVYDGKCAPQDPYYSSAYEGGADRAGNMYGAKSRYLDDDSAGRSGHPLKAPYYMDVI